MKSTIKALKYTTNYPKRSTVHTRGYDTFCIESPACNRSQGSGARSGSAKDSDYVAMSPTGEAGARPAASPGRVQFASEAL